MLHNHHSLIIYKNNIGIEDEINKRKLEDIEIIYKNIKNTLNKMYEEGLRALKDGDFKEKQVLPFIHSCDVCENSTDKIRFVCLNCRQLTLCK